MNDTDTSLPAVVDRAARVLAEAKTAAEVLEARELAGAAYDRAKREARFAKAKGAHDTLIATAHRTQANALEIEAAAKRRLADEYDAAQGRGEVAKAGQYHRANVENDDVSPATAAELGLRRDEIHEARKLRDAEVASPGLTFRVLDDCIANGEEPTRAALKRAAADATRNKDDAVKPANVVKMPAKPAGPEPMTRDELLPVIEALHALHARGLPKNTRAAADTLSDEDIHRVNAIRVEAAADWLASVARSMRTRAKKQRAQRN